MNRLLITIMLFIGLADTISAKPYEKVYMKDGTILEGYISEQYPGKNITVKLSWAEIVVPDSIVEIERIGNNNIASLSEDWKEWLNDNPTFKCDKRTDFYNLHFIGKSEWSDFCNKVKIIEKGKFIRYVIPTKHSKTVDYKEVQKIERIPREANVISGTNDILTTGKGTFTGQTVEIIPGTSITIMENNGLRQVIYNNEIVQQKKQPINNQQKLIEQVPYKDKVTTKDDHEYSGVIVQQDYTEKENEIHLLDNNNLTHNIKIGNIKKIAKDENKDYKPLKRIDLKENEVLLGYKKTGWQDIKDLKSNLTITIDSLVVLKKDSVFPSLKIAYSALIKSIYLLRAQPSKKNDYIYCEKNKVGDEIDYDNESIVDNLVRREYKIVSGYYLLYKKKDNKGIIFKIE